MWCAGAHIAEAASKHTSAIDMHPTTSEFVFGTIFILLWHV